MKIDNKIKISSKVSSKTTNAKKIVKEEKHNFSKIMKKVQRVEKIILDVYIIAAKIMNGEDISPIELQYIKENAPGLLEVAQMRKSQRKAVEKEEKQTLKETNTVNLHENNSDGSVKKEPDSSATKVYNDESSIRVLNNIINE